VISHPPPSPDRAYLGTTHSVVAINGA